MPVTLSHRAQYFIAVSTKSPFHSVSDLISAAKIKAGKISYGAPYVNSPAALGAALLAQLTGTEMVQVPLETSQLFLSVARGDVDWALGTYATMKPFIDSKLLRLLAVARDKRPTERPDIPTVPESGGPPDYSAQAWAGYVVMSGTPPWIVERLNRDIVRVFAEPAVHSRILATGSEPTPGTPQQMAEQVRLDTARYAKIVAMIQKKVPATAR